VNPAHRNHTADLDETTHEETQAWFFLGDWFNGFSVPGKPPKNGFSTFSIPQQGIYFEGFSEKSPKIMTFSELSLEPNPQCLDPVSLLRFAGYSS
jgi:hypothetical protein